MNENDNKLYIERENINQNVDSLKLDLNIVVCRVNGLEVKCSRAKSKVLDLNPSSRVVDAHC